MVCLKLRKERGRKKFLLLRSRPSKTDLTRRSKHVLNPNFQVKVREIWALFEFGPTCMIQIYIRVGFDYGKTGLSLGQERIEPHYPRIFHIIFLGNFKYHIWVGFGSMPHDQI